MSSPLPETQCRWDTHWADRSNHPWWEQPAPEILELVRSQSPKSRPDVLDLGCGLGRHAIAFAQAGFTVTAADASPVAIDHLRRWADELGLAMRACVCLVPSPVFAAASFDIVVSHNVIYHGRREDFAAAIRLVATVLRPGGLFFFTCPTRRDDKYGHGKQIAPHTFACDRSMTPGDVHYFADEKDLDELLAGFRVICRGLDEGYWNHRGQRQFFSNWQVLAELEQMPG